MLINREPAVPGVDTPEGDARKRSRSELEVACQDAVSDSTNDAQEAMPLICCTVSERASAGDETCKMGPVSVMCALIHSRWLQRQLRSRVRHSFMGDCDHAESQTFQLDKGREVPPAFRLPGRAVYDWADVAGQSSRVKCQIEHVDAALVSCSTLNPDSNIVRI
jgi:hypothetical protein